MTSDWTELNWRNVEGKEKCLSFSLPWEFQTPFSLGTPGLLINLPWNWLSHHPVISSSVVPFSSCLQSFPVSGSFPMIWLFASGGQSIGALASAYVLSMHIQGWFPLGWTGWISLQSKGPWRVFSNTTVQKHQFFGAQPSLWSNSHHKLYKYLKPKIQSKREKTQMDWKQKQISLTGYQNNNVLFQVTFECHTLCITIGPVLSIWLYSKDKKVLQKTKTKLHLVNR